MSIPNDEGDDELRKAVSENEARAEWGGSAVVFGLVVEVVLTAAYRHGESIIEAWGPVSADALIALGVAAEILFARKARSKAESLQHRSDLKVAEANARAAHAQLETEKLRTELSWRRISAAEVASISKFLADFPKYSLLLEHVADDPESNSFAHDIGSIFSKCGWTVGFNAASYSGEVAFGIRAPLFAPPDTDACGIARTALTRAGISLTGSPLPDFNFSSGSGEKVSRPLARMYVGPKPRPTFDREEATSAQTIASAARE